MKLTPPFSILLVGVALIAWLVMPTDVAAADVNSREPEVKIFSSSGTKLSSFLAFSQKFRGGASVALGDVNGDGTNEIIVGAGPGGGPQVRVFTSSGAELSNFFAYGASFRGGVKVASCDFDGDSIDEIVLGPGQGGGPQVRIVAMDGTTKFTPGFYPFAKSFKGGVNVACGDVTGDGSPEVIVGLGIGAEPKVKVLDRAGKSTGVEITPYADRDKGGVSVSVANVDGGAASEIVTSIYRFGRSLVKIYRANAQRTIVGQFEGWPENVQGGFHVAGGDVDHDGVDEIVVALASGGSPRVRAFEAYGKALSTNFLAYDSTFRGGVNITVGDVTGDGVDEIITTPGRNTIQGRTSYQKYIDVKLDEQRLYAYENGVVVRTFLISSGVAKYPTPTGDFSVLAKVFEKDYEWSYGPDHPDNYDIKNVKWNLRFAPTYYLHYAFWHNNFGRRMSHGCVNINRENAEWIYNWADVGTPVFVRG